MEPIKKWLFKLQAIPAIKFIIDVFTRFGGDNGAFYAAGMSFFLLLAFAPMLLTGVAILGFFINVHSASTEVHQLILGLLPGGGARDEAAKFLTQQINLDAEVQKIRQSRGIASVVGLLSVTWSSIQIFINASVAMNAMWEVKETRNWFVIRGLAFLLMIATGVLLVVTLVLSGAPTAVAKFDLPIIHHLPVPLPVLTVLFELAAVIVNGVMYTLIYKLLPNSKVPWLSAAIGGLTASVLFEIAKKGLAVYLLHANTSIYGTLANLILFVLWIYYSMTILLLGAEITGVHQRILAAREKHNTELPRNIRARTRGGNAGGQDKAREARKSPA